MIDFIIPSASANYLEDLNLSNCRITQDEESHIKKGNGSMYALDIACIRGVPFKVNTPEYFNIYEVDNIGYDKRLGDYIVIRHGEFRIVYGHLRAKQNLKVGDRITNGVLLGEINISGISNGMHLHVELWKRNSNIKFSHLYGENIISSPLSQELRSQRGWITDLEINQEILSFIGGFEGLHLRAYWDVKQWSIGYGTKSFKGEVITKEEAEKRARQRIQSIRERYSLSHLEINKQKAIVSFVYNIGSLTQKQQWLLNNEYYRALGNNFLQYNKMTVIKDGEKEKVIAGGLVKRRQAEFNLLIR